MNTECEVSIYDNLLLEGETFWTQHHRHTLFQIQDAINLMNVAHRLPDCIWEDLRGIHATNYASIYSLTKRMIDASYPDAHTKIKPSKTFLNWIYSRLKDAST